MKYLIRKCLYLLLVIVSLSMTSCSSSKKKALLSIEKVSEASFNASKEFVYYNNRNVALVKEKIKANDPYFIENYEAVIKAGNTAMNYKADPVTNKTEIPPSKDMHDYISYAPYRWPDSTKVDGLPWVPRDGIINPISRGAGTDFRRKDDFFDAIDILSWSYYFSGDEKYSKKAMALIKVWYLNPETRVNPNLNFGQGHPGIASGTKAGVHEWDDQSFVITALQMFEFNGVLSPEMKHGMYTWFSEYLNWLITNPMAIDAGYTRQNHANHYTFQVVGLMMYLGKNEEAKAVVEDAKQSRIADQIRPDGGQPRELGRTKSVSYSNTNLWLMTEIALMGQKLDVDLWQYETEDGRSLKKAYTFLAYYVLNPDEWPEKQISKGGPAKTLENGTKPLFSKASTALEVSLLDQELKAYLNLNPLDVLLYPPQEKLPQIKK
ncbi:alginate lyase family protein [Formosa sp. PL04]|uniref:alginate lyase family protein n=1 Tax=Formosa sp. PL04 TaxID=3081755 RepID=UPI0029817799|nr:alginate lyase family protein [Formosa sp. PL04]MDW5288135.1 alginate lyase family protein [Formosa sp. PL04]